MTTQALLSDTPNSSSSATTTRRREFGVRIFSLGHELQHVDVQGLIRHDALETRVLLLEFLQALGVVGLHAAILIAPAVPGRLGDLELPAHFGHVVTLIEKLLAFGEFSDHLFGAVTPLLHYCPPRSILEHRDSHY
jgi:hypothetical protein